MTSAVPLTAQLTELRAGTRVRVEAPGIVPGRYSAALVVTRTADTLVIGGPNTIPLSVPFVGIRSLAISRGNSRVDGAITGMKWAVPIMTGLGAAIASAASESPCISCPPVKTQLVGVTALCALGGAIIGGGIGARIGRERWDELDFEPRTSVLLQRGRIGLGVDFGF